MCMGAAVPPGRTTVLMKWAWPEVNGWRAAGELYQKSGQQMAMAGAALAGSAGRTT